MNLVTSDHTPTLTPLGYHNGTLGYLIFPFYDEDNPQSLLSVRIE